MLAVMPQHFTTAEYARTAGSNTELRITGFAKATVCCVAEDRTRKMG